MYVHVHAQQGLCGVRKYGDLAKAAGLSRVGQDLTEKLITISVLEHGAENLLYRSLLILPF
jgi:hypothetical protein